MHAVPHPDSTPTPTVQGEGEKVSHLSCWRKSVSCPNSRLCSDLRVKSEKPPRAGVRDPFPWHTSETSPWTIRLSGRPGITHFLSVQGLLNKCPLKIPSRGNMASLISPAVWMVHWALKTWCRDTSRQPLKDRWTVNQQFGHMTACLSQANRFTDITQCYVVCYVCLAGVNVCVSPCECVHILFFLSH